MADDGLKRIKLSEDYAGRKAGSIYVCDPVRAQWLLDNDHGREATAADLKPKREREGGYQASEGPKQPKPAGDFVTGTDRPRTRRKR